MRRERRGRRGKGWPAESRVGNRHTCGLIPGDSHNELGEMRRDKREKG
jgi:hypothetical protein